jgi:hypothetical protein
MDINYYWFVFPPEKRVVAAAGYAHHPGIRASHAPVFRPRLTKML